MCCTFGDSTDIRWYHLHNLPLRNAIGRDGRMTELAGPLAGLRIEQARSTSYGICRSRERSYSRIPLSIVLAYTSAVARPLSTCMLVSGLFVFWTRKSACWRPDVVSSGSLSICGCAMSIGSRTCNGIGVSRASVFSVSLFLPGPVVSAVRPSWQLPNNCQLIPVSANLSSPVVVARTTSLRKWTLWIPGPLRRVRHRSLDVGQTIQTASHNTFPPICARRDTTSYAPGPFTRSSNPCDRS